MTNCSFNQKINFSLLHLFIHILLVINILCVCVHAQTIPLLPLSRLAPRLRRSVEGLNLELEGVFVSETAEEQHKVRHYAHMIKHQPCLTLKLNIYIYIYIHNLETAVLDNALLGCLFYLKVLAVKLSNKIYLWIKSMFLLFCSELPNHAFDSVWLCVYFK